MVVLLAPLDEATLEVGLGLYQGVELQVVSKYLVDEQTVGKVVTLIQVDGAHHRFERIAVDVFLR